MTTEQQRDSYGAFVLVNITYMATIHYSEFVFGCNSVLEEIMTGSKLLIYIVIYYLLASVLLEAFSGR
jgi:hypothetical protein